MAVGCAAGAVSVASAGKAAVTVAVAPFAAHPFKDHPAWAVRRRVLSLLLGARGFAGVPGHVLARAWQLHNL